MSRQVLILNVTRMGDLIQMGTLLARLRHEWPDAEIDLVVDRQFAAVASVLPFVRRTHAFDFDRLMNDCRAMSRDVVSLYRELKTWAQPLVDATYDRLINLTFTRRSGLLARYLQIPDVRGVVCAPDGATAIRNPWLSYFTDLHQYRRFNRFNLVDLYALGGSGPGPFAPLSLTVTDEARSWADACLGSSSLSDGWVAIQIGASEAIKAWRPAYFGRTMAKLSRQASIGFVLIGTEAERAAVQQALAVYREAGGSAPVRDMVAQTSLPQLIALLSRTRLLLTNDTGPMHMAVAVGTKVIDLSVGHVDFHETGPYGRGHWVVQPDLECAPCGFDRICMHQACKDQVEVDLVASLCAHALDRGSVPSMSHGAQLFESDVDSDGLVYYRQRAGRIDVRADWYGRWWRQFWFAECTGHAVTPDDIDTPPIDWEDIVRRYAEMGPLVRRLTTSVNALERAAKRVPLRADELQAIHQSLTECQRDIGRLALDSPAFGPLTVALQRELASDEEMSVSAMARARVQAFRRWADRLERVQRLWQQVAQRGKRKLLCAGS